MPHRQGKNAADSDTPLPARQEADSPAENAAKRPAFVGAAYGFAAARLGLGTSAPCKAHTFADRTGRIFVRSIARCGAAGWRRMCPLTKRHLRNFCKRIARRRTAKPVQHLLDAVQAAQFAPDPCTAETAQEIQTLCRKLRKKLCRRTV